MFDSTDDKNLDLLAAMIGTQQAIKSEDSPLYVAALITAASQLAARLSAYIGTSAAYTVFEGAATILDSGIQFAEDSGVVEGSFEVEGRLDVLVTLQEKCHEARTACHSQNEAELLPTGTYVARGGSS